MIELSLHGRGGQGVVAAGELLVKGAVKQGIYAQSIPFFGGERSGAPVRSVVRISDSPIYTHESIKNADIMAIFDVSLLDVVDLHILKEGGSLLINSPSSKKFYKIIIRWMQKALQSLCFGYLWLAFGK